MRRQTSRHAKAYTNMYSSSMAGWRARASVYTQCALGRWVSRGLQSRARARESVENFSARSRRALRVPAFSRNIARTRGLLFASGKHA